MSVGFTRWWVLVSALLIAAGWILSALHALNRAGYAVALVIIAAVSLSVVRREEWRRPRWRRFRRWLPLSFALIATLIGISGLLHAPNNFDALAYRIPRTLHWLAEGHWHWIDTNFQRLNVRGQGTEWTMAPLLLFTRTDRSVWLLNFLPFLAMPGLVYSVFTRAGVGPRVAWSWMWLLPCGYGLAGQAGGSANDMPGAFFALAAVDFALRARQSGRVSDVWLSTLAAGVLTAIKLSSPAFGLVWIAAIWPSWHLALRRPLLGGAVALVAVLASFVPTALLNHRHCGDWSGAAVEYPMTLQPRPPGLVFAANAVSLAVVNLAPPVFPWAGLWNAWARDQWPDKWLAAIRQTYGEQFCPTDAPELPVEDWAGMGCGVTLLLIASAAAVRRGGRTTLAQRLLHWSPWASLAIILAAMPIVGVPRQCMPIYAFLPLAILARPGQAAFLRTRSWRALAAFIVLSCIVTLILNPARPLWPALGTLSQAPSRSAIFKRAHDVYEAYAVRSDALAPVRAQIPSSVKTLGLVAHNSLEASLWRPFGSRQFIHVHVGASRESMEQDGLEYIVLQGSIVVDLERWLENLDASIIAKIELRSTASGPVDEWVIARLPIAPGDR